MRSPLVVSLVLDLSSSLGVTVAVGSSGGGFLEEESVFCCFFADEDFGGRGPSSEVGLSLLIFWPDLLFHLLPVLGGSWSAVIQIILWVQLTFV